MADSKTGKIVDSIQRGSSSGNKSYSTKKIISKYDLSKCVSSTGRCFNIV